MLTKPILEKAVTDFVTFYNSGLLDEACAVYESLVKYFDDHVTLFGRETVREYLAKNYETGAIVESKITGIFISPSGGTAIVDTLFTISYAEPKRPSDYGKASLFFREEDGTAKIFCDLSLMFNP